MRCEVCNIEESKYKCPLCAIPFCSVGCWRSHKAGECGLRNGFTATPADTVESDTVPHYTHTTEDTIPVDKLQLLKSSEVLRRLLQDPHLLDVLTVIDNSAEPDEAIRAAMQEPMFVEFADECLRVVGPLPSPP